MRLQYNLACQNVRRAKSSPSASSRRRSRGAIASVELAIIIPILGIIMLGMFELGRAVMVKQTLTAAARKGCRTGIIHQYGNTDITNDATNIMRDAGFDVTLFNPPTIGSITITVTAQDGTVLADALDAAPGSVVSVQISIPVSSVQWVSSYFLPSNDFESDVITMMKQ
jgi:Flp pilus assembly protein TadG